MSLNKVTLSGHLARDVELRYTKQGAPVANFTVAVNDRARQSDGTYADRTNWVDCVLFGKRGEALEPYLRKGVKIAATGKLYQSAWTQDGKQRSKLEIHVDEIDLMTNLRDRQTPQAPSGLLSEDVPF